MSTAMTIVFDVIITALGAYLLYLSQKMRNEGRVPPILVTPEEMRGCRNEKAFVAFLFPRVLAFALTDLLFGVAGLYNDVIYNLGDAVNAVLVIIFIGMWIWFSLQLRKGKRDFL